MIRIGIVGARGYTGRELVRLLLRHPEAKIVKLWAKKIVGREEDFGSYCPEFRDRLDLKLREFSLKEVKNIDVLFLALPHRVANQMVPQLIEKVGLLIDLSADYRFKNYRLYEKWYQVQHKDRAHLKMAVYGISEIMREKIRGARLIANPGCYSTGIILSLYPLVKENLLNQANIIVDSKSGTSGAGRKQDIDLLFSELAQNIRPYKINRHQHMPEVLSFIQEQFGQKLNLKFVPQIVPLSRGIMNTIYVLFKKAGARRELYSLYRRCYQGERFIRIYGRGEAPALKSILQTNFCDLGYLDYLDKETFLIISALDNLGKGASGQAVQNMNIALGLDEELGLR